MRTDTLKLGVAGACILALGACGSTQTASTTGTIPVTTTTTSSTTSSASGYGVVQSIDLVPRQQAQAGGIGLGTIAGAVVGGVLGNQVGGGTGRTAATVAGAAGGALAGRELEKGGTAQSSDQAYRVSVRMDNGALQTLTQDTTGGLQVGERVRVSNGVIVERVR